MNIDNLHDALGLLDDDLIEEVDALRSERKQYNKSCSTKRVIRWTALAACLSVFLISICAVSILWRNGFGGQKKSMSSDEAVKGKVVKENETMSEDIDDSSIKQESAITENTSEVTDASVSTAEVPSVLVEIKAWHEDGFVGTIAGIVDTEKYAIGTEVTVKFSEEVYDGESSVTGVQYKEENTLDSENFPIGSVVSVQFHSQEVTPSSTENDAVDEEIVLYAESIALVDEN